MVTRVDVATLGATTLSPTNIPIGSSNVEIVWPLPITRIVSCCMELEVGLLPSPYLGFCQTLLLWAAELHL